MDRAAARRARSHETRASAIAPCPRHRRRSASAAAGGSPAAPAGARVSPAGSSASVGCPDPVIVLDDDDCGAAAGASSGRRRRGRGAGSAVPVPGAVATRTRSRKLGLWRRVAESSQSSYRRVALAAAESDGEVGGGGSEGTVEGSISSRSGSNEERLASSWGTSESVAGDSVGGCGGKDEACFEVEVAQVDGDGEIRLANAEGNSNAEGEVQEFRREVEAAEGNSRAGAAMEVHEDWKVGENVGRCNADEVNGEVRVGDVLDAGENCATKWENCNVDENGGRHCEAHRAMEEERVGDVLDSGGNGEMAGEDCNVDENEEPCEADEVVGEERVRDAIDTDKNCDMEAEYRELFGDMHANESSYQADGEMEASEDLMVDGDRSPCEWEEEILAAEGIQYVPDTHEIGQGEREVFQVDNLNKMEAVEGHEVGGDGPCEKKELIREEGVRDALHAEANGAREGEAVQQFAQGDMQIEVLDSTEEVEVLNDDDDDDDDDGRKGRALVQAKIPVVASCVAWRTRSSWGVRDRISYTNYFEALSDEPKEDDDDDTEVELDEEEEEEDEEDEEDEEEENRANNGADTTDDERIDAMLRYGLECDDEEDPDVEIIEPLSFEKDSGEDTLNGSIAAQQKRSRFTWELERKKRLKLGIMMKRRRLYERDLESESGSSDSGREGSHKHLGKGGGKGNKAFLDQKAGRTKKDQRMQSAKLGKKGRAAMLKRQSLLKLLIDTMCGDKDKESFLLEQNHQIEYHVKDLHPLIFSFGDEDPVSVERSEHEIALNVLWADLDFALESENIGTYHDDEGQGEQNNELDLSITPVTCCSRGKHEFIIDEQVGITCKFCSLVNLEIRYILPSLASSFGEKPAWRNASSVKHALMYDHLCERAENDDEQACSGHLNGTVWDLIPGVITTMYQHQREAFEFMWTNLVGGIRLEEFKGGARPDVVGGCVICHAPGTGKTRLAIVFIQTYMKVFPDCRPVIIAPRGMLFAWEEEFKKWDVNVPFHIMNTAEYSGKEDRAICKLIKKEHRTEKLTRLVKLLSWNKGHGILGISYGLYKKLTSDKSDSSEDTKVRSILLEKPGLLVLDEGHTPRNERSVIWKTLGKVKTEKRIILSGTPFQNNFLELYNILCLVRPKFGEIFLTKSKVGRRNFISKKERDLFSDKYEKGIWASLTSHVTDDNADKVRSILKPFVHIHNGNILRTLPGLRECVIVLKPLPLQKSIIKKVENIGSGNNFEHEYIISLASIHPSLVTAINMTEEEASLIDKPSLEKLRSDPYEGVKTRFVVEVVRLCEALKEKVLIFSQFIQPLSLIKDHLRKFFKWREGKEILQMDGKILPRYRQASIDAFNDPESDARVLLASTRACCEGISLTGASRVVLLDVVWNPAVGRQAISRAYRIGQQKFVYTYNLITYGTGEGDKYDRQAEKDHLSKLVFSTEDEFNNVRNTLSRAEVEHCSKLISEDKVLEEMTFHDQLKGMFLKIYYPPTESNIIYTYNQIAPE